jgi:dGTPase
MTEEVSVSPRARAWAGTMAGHASERIVRAHRGPQPTLGPGPVIDRRAREDREAALLRPGATLANGAGDRSIPEEPDSERTCFERDRDRIVHSTAFRRLAGKTQVVVYPSDHQRTRLTHALEVSQVATSIARGAGLNVSLTEAIALGHDCGHGPGGHASEDAFDPYIPGGYEHGPWGADVVLDGLNLCAQTRDGIRNHSWSQPAPATAEGEVVSWADRIAYCAHDLEDAVHTGIVDVADLPPEIAAVCGRDRRQQLSTFIRAVIATIADHDDVGMDPAHAAALAGLREFNYERIYVRTESRRQSSAVIDVLQALVDFYIEHPARLGRDNGAGSDRPVRSAVTYVGGMTDRYAFDTAVALLGWDERRLPRGIDRG